MSELRLLSRPGVEDITGITEFIDGDFVERVAEGGGKMRYTYYVPTEPEVPEVPTITKITRRSFMRRFTQPERTTIRKSADDIVIDIYEDLQSVNNVDLTLDDTINAIGYLTAVGILGADRDVDILADGTEDEV